jgi:isoleucyl-tRNA synthetase
MTHTAKTPHYPTIHSDVHFPTLERDVLAFWQRESVFEQSVENRPATEQGSSNAYVFYDGPPFANGLPHHGHLLTGYVKDMVARYQTMKGRRVERRFGWDCHGLPAEMEAEKQLGVSGRAQIIEYGVEKFNAHCRTSVMAYRDEWEAYVNRQARWVDFANDYKTMDTPYMESVLWAFSELHKKGLVYEGFKVMPYSWAAETVLSTSEIRMDDATREKVDKAITVAFKLKEKPKGAPDADEYYLLAWTTTPWTLPSNLALAVSENIYYQAHVKDNKCYYATQQRIDEIFGTEYSKTGKGNPNHPIDTDMGLTISGDKFFNLSYEPLFPYFANHPNAFRVLNSRIDGGDDFIEEGSGTGVVHMAPGFGEDDMRICAANGIEVVVPVDSEGRYTDAIYDIGTLESARCILKIPTQEDEQHFIALHTNADVMRTMNDGVMTIQQAKEDFATNMQHFRDRGYGQWAIYHKESGAFMGRAGLSFIAQASDMPPRPTLRCGLLPAFWHGGYGSELCAASLTYGFDVQGFQEIAAGAYPDNPRAHTMLEKLGMHFVGEALFKRDTGRYYLITKDQWQQGVGDRGKGLVHNTLSLKGLNVIQETEKLNTEELANQKQYGKTSKYSIEKLKQFGLANIRILEWLKGTNAWVKPPEDYAHNYPHCWRTDKPIIYRAMSSWFVDVPQIRDRMVELNQQINWIPDHIKDGRFGKWLEGAREWSISRSRFWGCPIPVWRSDNPDNKELYVFGSIAELEAFFEVKVEDLHKPFIDTLTKPDPTNPRYTLRRVDEVFDCWFESGSMPYAQVHYPFENKEWFEANFPADFIVEYEAQTRGWFYNMMVLSVALFDRIPFKNCICHGVVLDGEGRKLSKKLKNYISPMELFDVYGSDALRWFMLSSTIMRGNELFLDAEGTFIRDAVRLYIKPLWNAYHFFCLYANADGVQAAFDVGSENIMDRYILAKLKGCVEAVECSLDSYDTPSACNAVTGFLEVLNNWYIRRNRSRFWGEAVDADKQAAYNTLYTVLHILCRVVAPLLPQVSEAIFAGLTNGGAFDKAHSVHVQDYPCELQDYAEDAALMQAMDRVQDICNTAHAIRNEVNIRTRQPLNTLTVYGAGIAMKQEYFKALIADETNVKTVVFSDELDAVATRNLKINFPIVGKRLPTKMKAITAAARAGQWQFSEEGNVLIEGEMLMKGEFEFTLQSTLKEGSVRALSAQDGLVVLDTTLTDVLLQEGIARDVVRLIQQSRKEAGLDVADRIMLTLDAPAHVQQAVQVYGDYVQEQTLCVALHYGTGEGTHRATHTLGEAAITLIFDVASQQTGKVHVA